jgi:hypothetical protein
MGIRSGQRFANHPCLVGVSGGGNGAAYPTSLDYGFDIECGRRVDVACAN